MKASSRAIIDREQIAIASSSRELWTPKLVRDALVDAFRMLHRVGGPVGPAALKAYWPTYQMDQADFNEQSISGTLQQARPKAPYRTRISATRMEAVICGDGDLPPWMDLVREAPDLQRIMRIWIKAELRGDAIKEMCRDRGMVYTTFLTHRDRAAGIIAQRLNAARVAVW